MSSNTTFIEDFIAGGVGGVCTIASGHPFDTIKVRLQTMSNSSYGNGQTYTGALDCLKKTVKNEGFCALYKGMESPLLSSIPLFAIFFGGVGVGRWLQQTHHDEKLTLIQNFNAGAFAGIVSCIIVVPSEHIKCILQVQSKGNSNDGPWNILKKLYKEGGIRNIYRGTGATLLRDIPSSGVYISVYEYLKNYFAEKNKTSTISPMAALFSGGCAGLASWSVCIPADVIKSRLQISHEGKYKNGMRSVVKQILKYEGFRGFFSGFVPVMLRAFPANAACFLGIELTLDIFRIFKK